MKRKIVFKMILLETVILSFTGTFAGLVITALLIAILSKTGINLTMFSKGLNQFGIGNVLYPYIPLSMIIALVVMVLVASVISAIFPAYQALALKPSEALRLT